MKVIDKYNVCLLNEGFKKDCFVPASSNMNESYTWNPFGEPGVNTDLDLDFLKSEIGQRFPFYDIRFDKKTAAFFVRIDENLLEDNFESLRISLSKKGYIPMIRDEKGEQIIYVIKKPKTKKRPIWVNFILLIATIFTTTLAGSIQWVSINYGDWTQHFDQVINLVYLSKGLVFFSIPLMLILGIHEMGHYFTSKKHNLDTSLPFFIPMPPPFVLGTFGALISTREPIPDRKSLLDVGVSGPICGFLVAIPVCIIGLFFMQENPLQPVADFEQIRYTYPLLLQGLNSFFDISKDSIMHPTLFAGWVGLFLTAVNLIPVGQLDGGHVARALLKEKNKYATWAVIIVVIALGLFSTFWLMFAFIILFLIGTKHQPPLNEYSSLDINRIFLGIVAFIIFILCFAPIPFSA